MADPMKIRANAVGDSTEVKVLMSHEMETGQRKDAQGKTIPAWFIQNVMVAHNGKFVDSVPLAEAIGHLRTVPPDEGFVRAARALGISFGD